jgi:hypothetical protein
MASPSCLAWSCPVTIQATAEKLPTFEMLAYAGGKLKLGNVNAPVVVDLSTLTATANLPALRDHRIEQTVGHIEQLNNDGHTLTATGVISSTSCYATEIVDDARNGFVWQCSIGADPERLDFIARGESVFVNGQSFDGPAYISRNTLLREISFTAVGADANTSVAIAASATHGQTNMTFEQWLTNELELEPATLNEKQTASLQKAFTQLQTAEGLPTTVTATRAIESGETLRIASIRRICNNEFPAIESEAIQAGWDERQTRLQIVRAKRPVAPSIPYLRNDDLEIETRAIQASLCIDSGVHPDRLVKAYGERIVEAAEHRYKGCGLHGAFRAVLRAAGKPCGLGRIGATEIRDAFEADRQLRASGFSSQSLTNMLGNTANKLLLDQFQLVATTWRTFCKVEANNDFKEHKRFRLVGKGKFEQVAPDGVIKHIWLDEQEFSSTLLTRGAMVAITRQDIINDDLNAFSQTPQLLGRLSGIQLERSVYEMLLSNPSNFFHSDNGNYLTGADTALSIAALTNAENLFLKAVDDSAFGTVTEFRTTLV